MDFPVNDVASQGLILDIPEYQLPPEAWTTAENIRITDDGIGVGATWTQILNTSTAAPYYVQAIRTAPLAQWFIYADLNKVYAWDGTSTADISGTSQPYSTANGWDWVGTQLAGTPVLTNNVKPPQYWQALSLASTLADLPNWTAALGANSYCRSIRAFGPYLVAMNVTLNAVAHPHGVLWSQPADPGAMPTSWDYTDPTKDAGFTELTDADAGSIIDGLPLRGQFIIYKENATWLMRLIGGQFIFQFDPLFLSSGILAPHCAGITGDGKFHFVATGDDIIVHDGVTARSVLDRKMRRTIFNRIDVSAFNQSFVFSNSSQREMWFAYPESGASAVTRAVVWRYGPDGSGVLSESVFPYQSACIADVANAGETWDSDTDTWDSTTDIWDASSRRQVILADATGKQLLQMDVGVQRAGMNFTATLSREALAIDGKRRSGEPVVNFLMRKFVRRIWPRMEGGVCSIRLGMTDNVNGTTDWKPAQTFDPSTQKYLDFTVNGSGAPAVEFTWTGTTGTLYGYTIEVFNAGRF